MKYINYRDAKTLHFKPKKEQVDVALTKAVGKEVLMGTPSHRKAAHLIAKWSANRGDDDLRSVDYTQDKDKLKQLKDAVGAR